MTSNQYKKIAAAPIALAVITVSQADQTADTVCLFFAALFAASICIVMAAKSEETAKAKR